MTSLREKIIADIGEISEYLSKQTEGDRSHYRQGYGGKAERMITLLNSIFHSIADERTELSGQKWYAVTAAAFGAVLPEGDNLRTIGSGLEAISVKGETVEVTRGLEVWKHLPARKEPVTKWVQTDENTRVRETVSDAFGKPKMKKLAAEVVSEQVKMVFSFPLAFFEDLLAEIDQDSLIMAPSESYVPEPLGVNLRKALGDLGALFGGSFVYDGWGGPPMMHPMYRTNGGRSTMPFRLFLKPEEDSGRLEVIVEPYPAEEVKANRTLISERENWRKGEIFQTKAVAALRERVKATYAEMKAVKKGDRA